MKHHDMKDIQVIKVNGKPAFAVMPYEAYTSLIEVLEDYKDIKALEAFEQSPSEGYPAAVVDRLINGENPFKVWREYRKLSGQSLSKQVGISAAYLSQLESGMREPSVKTLQALSKALDVDMDLLLFEGAE